MSIPAWMKHYPDLKACLAIGTVNGLMFFFAQALIRQGFSALPVYSVYFSISISFFLLIQWLDYRSWRSGQRYAHSGRSYQQPHHSSNEAPSSEDSVDQRTVNRLLCLLHGDEEAAWRLYKRELARHPDRSEQWCMEKTINDLIRDRSRE